MSNKPEGFTNAGWHEAATLDSGTSHVLEGRQYVVSCEWCDDVFFAPTKARALARFRYHEEEMTDEYNRETKPLRDAHNEATRMVFR